MQMGKKSVLKQCVWAKIRSIKLKNRDKPVKNTKSNIRIHTYIIITDIISNINSIA